MHTSPIHPPRLPKNRSRYVRSNCDRAWTLPSLNITRGVAEVMASTLNGFGNSVICFGHEANKNARAPNAGLKILAPRPPKACLQMAIAKKPPAIGIHKGMLEERLYAKRRPVSAAEPSVIVIFLLVSFCIITSVIMQLRMEAIIIRREARPNITTPAMPAGRRAKNTAHITLDTVSPLCILCEGRNKYLFYIFFFFL